MGLIDRSLLLEISRVAIELGLDQNREGLLGGIDRAYTSTLSIAAAPAAQLLSDLTALDDAERLQDGSIPLRLWLENAIFLAAMRGQTELFQRGLDAIDLRLAAPVQATLPPPRPRSRFLIAAVSVTIVLLLGVAFVLFRDPPERAVWMVLDEAAWMAIAPSETTSIALEPGAERTPNTRCATFTYCAVIEGLGAIPLGRSGVLIASQGAEIPPPASSSRVSKEAPVRVLEMIERGTKLRGELWKLDGHEYRSCGAIDHLVSAASPAVWTVDAAHCE